MGQLFQKQVSNRSFSGKIIPKNAIIKNIKWVILDKNFLQI